MGILPDQKKDGEIKFYLAKGLPYRLRMLAVAGALAAGLGLQLTAGFWPGYPLLILALLLGANSGYDSTPHIAGAESWEKVTPDEYEKIRLKAGQLKNWDDDFFDITSLTGIVGLALTTLVCIAAYYMAAEAWHFPFGYWIFFALDWLVLVLPLWLVGTREYLKKDRLLIKTDMLTQVMDALKEDSRVQVQPMLALCPTTLGGRSPEDARLMLKLVGAPKDLYGVQVQVSINSVQGKDYPYLYCVIIAKAGSKLLEDWRAFKERREESLLDGVMNFLLSRTAGALVYESEDNAEVSIIVVRQETTRSSGYFTQPEAAQKLVASALEMTRTLAAKNGPKQV